MNQTDYGENSSRRVWIILAAVLAVAVILISTWSCNANRDQRLAAEKVIEQQEREITRLVGEVDKANLIIRDAYTEIDRLEGEVDKANGVIQDANLEIGRLNREVDKANNTIRQQNVALECYAKKSNDSEFLELVGNIILPGLGGAIGSTLGQQGEC